MLVAVDTGGTKTLVATFNRRGQIVMQQRFPTPRDTAAYIEQLKLTIRELTGGEAIDAIGLAIPGIIKNDIAVWCPNLGWKDFPVRSELKRFFRCPIYVDNDANLAGLAEARSLGRQVPICIYLTVSTGIGMGLVINGSLQRELAITEPGHMLLEYDGKLRKWESFASGRAIKDTYDAFARDIHSKRIWSQIADKISRGMLTIIPTLNPDVIVIGGSIGTYFDRYGEVLSRHLRKHLDPHIPLPEIRQALHPEEAVIYGCYYYATSRPTAKKAPH